MGASPLRDDKTPASGNSGRREGAPAPKNTDFAARVADLKKRYPKILARLAE